MTGADEGRFETLIRALAETMGKDLTPGQILGYRIALDDLPIEGIETAVGAAIRTKRYMPVPAELRELAGVMTAPTRAVLAWGAVKRAVHQVSAYGSVDFDDPTINATIRNMGGWVRLCGSDAADFDTWARKDFERIYLHLAASGAVSEDLGRYLPGIFDEPPRRFATGLPAVERKQLGAA